jgi:hypothetical protein
MTIRILPILEAERVTLQAVRAEIRKCHFCTEEVRCVGHERIETRLIEKCFPTERK